MALNVVQKLKAGHTTKDHILAHLKELIASVESGNVDSVLFISRGLDGYWNWSFAGKVSYLEMLGRMDVVKAELVEAIIKDKS